MNSKNRFARLALLAGTTFTMAFTMPGCPDTEALNAQIASLEKKATDTARQNKEIADQLRILNDEHNAMKSLVSQISTTVLEQKDTVERLDASIRELSTRRAAPAAKKASVKKRR